VGEHPRRLELVSDFGSAEAFANTETSSNLRGCSPTYRPPDSDMDQGFSLASDVWSLGCLFLEFVTWYLSGYEATEAFSHFRLSRHRNCDFFVDTFFLLLKSKDHEIRII